MDAVEKTGAFYLGCRYEPRRSAVTDEPILYDAKDLTTHAVILGMTGSGKTGLGIALLEEAAIDGIPSIVIDPKGDMGNLLLTFPSLNPVEFQPWIDPAHALGRGQSVEGEARRVARMWSDGLQRWGQDGRRIERLKKAANFQLFTPGSQAGRPISVIRKFSAPGAELARDSDALRERISAAASGLLALLGLDADPISSREHVLVSCILSEAWRRGADLDLPGLIRAIQSPPFERIGMMDLETVFPGAERVALALRLNNLIASPDFAGWMEGEPLDIGRLLWDEGGRPNVSIMSIAHLAEPQRMFFVTTLLGEIVAYMRSLSGSSGLRALVYMDEVFGYLPPTSSPPSKRPLLTLLKQARAYGIGLVVATQNPVDLDYKALSNAGTWFLGRLQTERDKARVIEGLEGASTASRQTFDRVALDSTLSGLGKRVFLMNNVHESEPVLFHTRWALSYLAGPLTQAQIQRLKGPVDAGNLKADRSPGWSKRQVGQRPPIVDPAISQSFVRPTIYPETGSKLLYRPALAAEVGLHYVQVRSGIDHWSRCVCLAPLASRIRSGVWSRAVFFDDLDLSLEDEPEPNAAFATLAGAAQRAKSYTSWKRSLESLVYKARPLIIHKCAALKIVSRVDETESAFMVRLREAARERRDLEVEKLRKRYAPRLARLRDRMRRQEQRIEREESQVSQQKLQTAISFGATMLGALFGRKIASASSLGRAATAMRGVGRISRESQDVARAQERLKQLGEQLVELEAEFKDALAARKADLSPESFEVRQVIIRPRKTEIDIASLKLIWLPWWQDSTGVLTPAHPAAESIDG